MTSHGGDGLKPRPGESAGAFAARQQKFPDAPDGYHWRTAGEGNPPTLRRNPGMAEAGTHPKLSYDPASGKFVDDTSGKVFAHTEAVNTATKSAALPQGGGAQLTKDMDELYRQAAVAQDELSAATRQIASGNNGEALIPDKLKGIDRATEKMNAEYGGDGSNLTDLARSSVVFEDLDDLYKGLDQLKGEFEIVRIKDRFANPTSAGYRDVLVNVRMSNGHVVEMQFHVKSILDVKAGPGHAIYEQVRTIEATAKLEGRELTAAETKQIADLNQQSRGLYEEAIGAGKADAAPKADATPQTEGGAGANKDAAVAGKDGAPQTEGTQAEGAAPKRHPLRQAYVDEVEGLAPKAEQLKSQNAPLEQIARQMHAERRALGVKYKDLTPADKLAEISARNIDKYGDKLGPTVEWLRAQGKTWEQIIDSATRTGGKDLGL